MVIYSRYGYKYCLQKLYGEDEIDRFNAMSKFRVRIRSYLSSLKNFWTLSQTAIEKYTDATKGDYNFLDVVFRIKLTEMQIQEQQKILLSKRRQMPLLLTLLSCLFIYVPKIFAYVKDTDVLEWYEWTIFSCYLLLLALSVGFFYGAIFPKKMPHRYLPSQFYDDIFDKYKGKGWNDVEANQGVQITYLDYLEKILIQYLNSIGKIEKWFARFMIVFPVAILFYVLSIVNVFVHSGQNVKNKENMIEIKKIMVPSDMIHVKPIVVKEGVEIHYSVSPKARKTGNVLKPKESIRDSIKRVIRLRRANPSTNQIRYSK